MPADFTYIYIRPCPFKTSDLSRLNRAGPGRLEKDWGVGGGGVPGEAGVEF